ncbi:MAG: hypothetical protein AB1689_15800 [Thermodesulfobacteriota bacterium]
MASSTAQRGVLVVVQDAEFASVLRGAVINAGYRPTVVESAADARALLDAGLEPCVVLVAMSEDDEGRDFIRRHNADAKTATIPVIFFSVGNPATHAPSPIVSALVAFVERYCHATGTRG